MARFRICQSCGDMHQVDRWPHNCLPARFPRSDLPAPHVIRDTLGGINGIFHHGDAQRYDSKRAFRRATKERGYIEVGDERPQDRRHEHVHSPDREIERDVALAVQELEQKANAP